MDAPDCSDCGVAMERVSFGMREGLSEAQTPFVRTREPREGLLGRLGVRERAEVRAFLCPECGLVRLYADLERD